MSSPPISNARRIWTVVALLSATFLASLDATAVAPAMPRIVGELGGLPLYGWVFSAYLLTNTIATPLYGKLADVIGRKTTFLAGVAIFVAGSIACGVSSSMPVLIASRALQGLGAGAILPVTQTVMGDLFDVEARARVQGIFSLVWGASSVVGPFVGGLLVDHVSWRWIFLLNLPVGSVAGILLAVALRERRIGAKLKARDLLGIVPFDLLRDRAIGVPAASGFFVGAVLLPELAYLPLLLVGVHGQRATQAGSMLIPMSLAWTLATFVGGRLMLRLGYRTTIRAGLVLITIGGVATVLSIALPWWSILPVASIIGLGMGLVISTFTIAAQDRVSFERRGAVTALMLFTRSVGGTIAVGSVGFVLSRALLEGLAAHPEARGLDPSDIVSGALERLSPAARAAARDALGGALWWVFAAVAVAAALALVIGWLYPKIEHTPRETFVAPPPE